MGSPKEAGGAQVAHLKFPNVFLIHCSSVRWVPNAANPCTAGGMINACVLVSLPPFREGGRKTNVLYFLQLSSSFA